MHLRGFLLDRQFTEVETPILSPQAGGALAKPFVTHANALDHELSLRIAPELYLKVARMFDFIICFSVLIFFMVRARHAILTPR